MKYTEKQLNNMASPVSQSEEEKCKNAIKMIRDAMKELNYTDGGKNIRSYVVDTYSYTLDLRQQYSGNKITLLVQGSYTNKTNISSESDVDVAVIFVSKFTTRKRGGVSYNNYKIFDGTIFFLEVKDEGEKKLNKKF